MFCFVIEVTGWSIPRVFLPVRAPLDVAAQTSRMFRREALECVRERLFDMQTNPMGFMYGHHFERVCGLTQAVLDLEMFRGQHLGKAGGNGSSYSFKLAKSQAMEWAKRNEYMRDIDLRDKDALYPKDETIGFLYEC